MAAVPVAAAEGLGLGELFSGLGAAGSLAGAFGGAGEDFSIPTLGIQKFQSRARLSFIQQLFPERMANFRINEREFKKLPKAERARFGKERFRVPTTDELDALVSEQEQRDFGKLEQTRQRLADSPLFSQVFREAEQGVDFQGQFGNAFNRLAGQALGGQASRGLLNTPGAQGAALGPLALQAATMERQLNERARGQSQAIALGLPFGQVGTAKPRTTQQQDQFFFNLRALNQGAAQANQAAALGQQGFQSSLLGGLGQTFGNLGGLSGGGGLNSIFGGGGGSQGSQLPSNQQFSSNPFTITGG